MVEKIQNAVEDTIITPTSTIPVVRGVVKSFESDERSSLIPVGKVSPAIAEALKGKAVNVQRVPQPKG